MMQHLATMLVTGFAPTPMLRSARVALASTAAPVAPQMMLESTALDTVSNTLAGVVAVDGGTIGLEVSFAAFLAVILGLFIPSDAQGPAPSFRQPDSIGGTRYEDE